MKLLVNHQTHYRYSAMVHNSIQYIKMIPAHSARQRVHYWDVSVPGQRELKRDAFDNIWLTVNQCKPYQHMTIMAQGLVELNLNHDVASIDQMNPYLFLQPTESTTCNEAMKTFADRIVPELHRANLIQLAEYILHHVPYSPEQTSVHTSAIDAFEQRKGVCQDHSHILIAMCKYLGLPARYVSGYLYVPDSSHLASHAWAEVYLNNAWYCFDVSNQLFSPNSHIYVAIGRDYWDVAPVRGVRKNGGEESMSSMVQVLAAM
jgi:transglutaminase-like putative cysteine protease